MKSFAEYLNEIKISLEYHDKLNPRIWKNDKLKPEVRKKLLAFIAAWREFANIPENLVQDIVLTGGNANFNYTPMSDLDVHLIVDRNKLGKDRTMVDDYLKDKKVLWTLTHDITILGYPLEPYAQDPTETFHAGQGAYSLQNDEWIQKPEHGEYNFKKDKGLRKKVQFYMDMIDDLIDNRSDLDTFDVVKSKITTMRGAAIQKAGEFSFENLVFKELRNKGYLDKMTNYVKNYKDKDLSL
jgi:hypothetical protein